jgi:protein disulfide-isomerase
MKKLGLSLVAGLALLQVTRAAELQWTTDLPKAEAAAKEQNKVVLIDFTGSDWCTFCIKLHNEVLTTKKFQEYAAKNLVLVEADFPNSKPQPLPLQKANEQLRKKYDVSAFPTLVIVDGDGKLLGKKEGYSPGSGPSSVISEIEQIRKHS